MKTLLKIILVILGVILALILSLPLWLGSVVKPVAHAVVPPKTGSAFNLGTFALNPYTGHLTIGDLQLYNPPGYKQEMAFTLGALNVDVDMTSVLANTIVISDVDIRDVFVSYVSNDQGVNNFAAIMKNVRGSEKAEKKTEKTGAEKAKKSEGAQKKVIIDRLHIEGVKVQMGPLTLPVPAITLTGIGRKTGGATLVEVWNEVFAQVSKSLGIVGDGLKDLGSFGAQQADTLAKEATKVLEATKNLETTDKLKDAASGAGDLLRGAGKASGEQTEKAVNALKGLFK